MDVTTATALANEARRQEATARVSRLEGEATALAIQAQALSSANSDALRRLATARADLAAVQAGAGPGLTDEFGQKSVVDRRAYAEREAGQSAAIDYIKANPECTEEEAIAAWTDAAAQVREDRVRILQDPAGVLEEYTCNAAAAAAIPEPTWEAFRAFVVATDKTALMGM